MVTVGVVLFSSSLTGCIKSSDHEDGLFTIDRMVLRLILSRVWLFATA